MVNTKPPKFKVGDRVRIIEYKKIFRNGCLPNWTNKVLIIHTINPTVLKTYILKDSEDKVLERSFYKQKINITKYGDAFQLKKY